MKKAAQKMISPVFWTGLFVSISGLIWLGIYYTVAKTEAVLIIVSVFACIALQTAAWLGGRKFTKATFWPGLCMLAAGPATLWGAFAGPGALYGISVEVLDYTTWNDLPPLYYVAIPVMIVGILVCIAFVLTGLLSLSADLAGLSDKKEQKRRRQRLMAMQSTDPAREAAKPEPAEKPAQTATEKAKPTPPNDATRHIPTEVETPAEAAADEAAAERYQRGEEDAADDGGEAGTAAFTEKAPGHAVPAAIPVRPNVAPRWTPVRPSRPRAGLVNPAAAMDEPGGMPKNLFTPMARTQTRLESITQTLRLAAVRPAADGKEPPADPAATEPVRYVSPPEVSKTT